MQLFRCNAISPKSVALSIVMMGTTWSAHAQERLSIQNDQFNVRVTSASFGPVAATITSGTGSVSAVTGIPTTSTLTVPAFSFTMVEEGISNEVKTFTAGIIITENSSNRRLEVLIPGISMDFTGAGLVGTLTNPNVSIYARDAAASLIAQASVSSGGSVAFTGSSISFDAAGQISLLQGQGGVLADITTSINNTGLGYTYKVILKQTAGTATTFATANTTALPTATNNEFLLDGSAGGADIVDLSGGYYLTGTLSFAAASSGGGGSTSTPQQQSSEAAERAASLTNALFRIADSVSPATATAVLNATVADSTTAVNDIVGFLAAGTASPTVATDFITSLAKQVQAVSLITNNGGQVPAAIVTAIVSNTAKLVGALRGKTLTNTELLLLTDTLSGTITDVGALLTSLRGKFGFVSFNPGLSVNAITLDTSIEDISAIIDEVEATINNASEIPNLNISAATFNSLKGVSQTALELLLAPIGSQLGLTVSYNSQETTKALLTQNTTLLNRVLESVAINVGRSTSASSDALDAALSSAGLSGTPATKLRNDLRNFVKADSLTLDSGSGQSVASDTLGTALGASSLTVDATSTVITATLAGRKYTVLLKAVIPAPVAFPSGFHSLPDGSTLFVSGSLAYILVPAPANIVEFAKAVKTVGGGAFTTSIAPNGVISLNETATGIVFSATISDPAILSGTASASTTFTSPAGDQTASTYQYTVRYLNGETQKLSPAISNTAFFTSIGKFGFKTTTDRSTGVIHIDGLSFRPDYSVSPLTAADIAFHEMHKDSSGVAYRKVDTNNDGKTDYQIITSTGIQTAYGLQ